MTCLRRAQLDSKGLWAALNPAGWGTGEEKDGEEAGEGSM